MPDSKDILIRFIEECWNSRSRTICKELLAVDCQHYMPGADLPTVGPDAYQQLADSFLEGFPDTRFDVEEAFNEGERVCVVWTARATHTGPFNGIEATGNPVVLKGVAVSRVVDGRIVRLVSMFDNAGFTEQLGVPTRTASESWKKTTSAVP